MVIRPLVARSGISFSVLYSRPIYFLGPVKSSLGSPFNPHSHPFPYSFYIPRDTCFLPWLRVLLPPPPWHVPSHPLPAPGTSSQSSEEALSASVTISVTLHVPLSFPVPDTETSPRLGELTVTDVTPDSVGLSWTVPQGKFDSFMVQYKDRDGQPQVVPVAADQREVTISSLVPNRKYKFLLYGLAGRKQLGPISADGTTGEPQPYLLPFPELPLSEPQSWPRGLLMTFILLPAALA